MPRTLAPAPAPAAATPSSAPPAVTAPTRVLSSAVALAAPPAVRLTGDTAFSGGDPLLPTVRAPLESRFHASLDPVRVHSGTQAHDAASALSARAFTHGSHIFLGRGERATDLPLMAHEVAHVIQQSGGAPAVQRWAPGQIDVHEQEAEHASAAVSQGDSFQVTGRTPSPTVQRLGISDALDYFADKANFIPGFRMFTIVIGVNPINMSRTDRSPANILRAVIEFIPGGALITQALDNYGVFDRVGTWIDQQLRTLGMAGSMIRQAVMDFLDSLGLSDIFHLGDVWERAKRIFTAPIDRIISFLGGLVTGILGFIKDAILMPLARLAQGTRGWDLLIAVLGVNPITGEAVPRNADTLIGGFMKLIGQEEVWNNLKASGAVARAWAWFQGALAGLLGFVRQIPGMFVATLRSLELIDIVVITRAFSRVAGVFGGFIGQFLSWAGNQVMSLLQIIFEVVAPAVMPYIRRAGGALRSIFRDPVGFIRNLVRAGIQGFRQFGANFLGHLRASLIQWLTGTMSGASIYIPQAFTLREILKFVLSVLGLTWQNIRQKLVRVIGESAVAVLEAGFDIVLTLVTQGPAAAWEKIQEGISNLRDMVMEQVMTFVRDRVVQAAITRLVTSLNPAGAFIQAVIAIYNTVMFFVERLQQIAQVAMAFIDSMAAIASGSIGAAANRVEQTMAGLLTLVISFLARIAGLGRVSDAVKNIIDRVRAPIDRALDRVVDWIVATARRLGRVAVAGARSVLLRFTQPRSFSAAGEAHQIWITEAGEPQVASNAMPLGTRIGTWRRRASTLQAADRARAAAQIATCDQINIDLRQAAANALRARSQGNASALDAAQAIIDSKQAALQPVLSSLFQIFGDTATVTGADDEARFFALMETYDQVVVPLKRRGLVSGTPETVSRRFRSQWNNRQIAQAHGWILQMELVLASARNVGTGRYPYLTGVEVRIPGTVIDYTTRDRDVERQVDVDVATEVKRWGAMRERTARSGRIITIAEQVQSRINTLRNQIESSMRNPAYTVVTLEVRGQNMSQELRDALASELVYYRGLAATLHKRFVWRPV